MYGTPSGFWALAAPPLPLFEHPNIQRGAVGSISATGDSLGSVAVDARSNPHDAWTVRVVCASSGELHREGAVNPNALPTFRILHDGTQVGLIITPDATGRIDLPDYGYGLQLRNGSAGDAVTFGTSNSALIVTPKEAGLTLEIQVSEGANKRLSHSYDRQQHAIVLYLATNSSSAATTTSAKAAEYLNASGLGVSATAGGTGAGVVAAAAATALPFESFTAGDYWQFTTAPSPTVVACMDAAADEIDEAAGRFVSVPIADPGKRLLQVEAQIALWELIGRAGLQGNPDWKGYYPKRSLAWVDEVRDGARTPTNADEGATYFADLAVRVDRLSHEGGSPKI